MPIQAQICQRTFPSRHFSRPTNRPTTTRQSRTAIALTKPRLIHAERASAQAGSKATQDLRAGGNLFARFAI
jgi:hypothetical protein